jgi:urea carboxylase-associated protein 2
MSKSFAPALVVHSETVHGGRAWSGVIRRGYCLRIVDVEGGANVSTLLFNAEERSERYNMPDTLKAQHVFYLSAGRVCYSDMGRVLCSIIADGCGWHDTVCGVSDAETVQRKYGTGSYQSLRNDFHRNGRDLFLIELAKWGLGKQDLTASVNFFSKVSATDGGELRFVPEHSKAGAHVDLRADMNVLVVLNTCQHPLDPAATYHAKPCRLDIWRAGVAAEEDPCRQSCAENGRGFHNNEAYFCQYDRTWP